MNWSVKKNGLDLVVNNINSVDVIYAKITISKSIESVVPLLND